ncbi:IS30 family transposase [Streptomyces sp. NPDC001156]
MFEYHRGSKPGGTARVQARRKFVELVREGVGIKEASHAVGVSYRTGKVWVNGRAASSSNMARLPLPEFREPATCDLASGKSRYLNDEERGLISDLLREGRSIRVIAAALGRSPSTVSREIRRNRNANGTYRPHSAQRRATARRPRPKARKIDSHGELRTVIQSLLDKKWSPRQIVQWLRLKYPNREDMRIGVETIYRTLYAGGNLLQCEAKRVLRTRRHRRWPRSMARHHRSSASIRGMVMIKERPTEADDRLVAGHWEGDLITGPNLGGSAIGTLVERTTRFTKLLHLPGKGAVAMREALTAAMMEIPAQLRRSVTWDQGGEMAHHQQFTKTTGVPVFFCDPASPWQRGTNENTNGLLRQYFPKSTDLSVFTRIDLDSVSAELNERPREVLGWATPAERMAALLATS